MNGDTKTPRDLECLYDETVLLQQASLITAEQAAEIQQRIFSLAQAIKQDIAYRQLLKIEDRMVIDLTDNRLRLEWLIDAYTSLDDAFTSEYGCVLTPALREAIWGNVEEFIRSNADHYVDADLEDLQLHTNTLRKLRENGIITSVQLQNLREDQLREMKDIGPTTVNEIREALCAINRRLRYSDNT